jgi:hypothetical protein
MTDTLLALGFALVIAGAFLWSLPAGVIAVGLGAIAAAIVLERAGVRVVAGEGDSA